MAWSVCVLAVLLLQTAATSGQENATIAAATIAAVAEANVTESSPPAPPATRLPMPEGSSVPPPLTHQGNSTADAPNVTTASPGKDGAATALAAPALLVLLLVPCHRL